MDDIQRRQRQYADERIIQRDDIPISNLSTPDCAVKMRVSMQEISPMTVGFFVEPSTGFEPVTSFLPKKGCTKQLTIQMTDKEGIIGDVCSFESIGRQGGSVLKK